jgi:hypothetical protein
MSDIRQLEWTETRNGVSYSKGKLYKRFAITSRTNGYTVLDSSTGDIERTHTLIGARAWAAARVNARAICHPSNWERSNDAS